MDETRKLAIGMALEYIRDARVSSDLAYFSRVVKAIEKYLTGKSETICVDDKH